MRTSTYFLLSGALFVAVAFAGYVLVLVAFDTDDLARRVITNGLCVFPGAVGVVCMVFGFVGWLLGSPTQHHHHV